MSASPSVMRRLESAAPFSALVLALLVPAAILTALSALDIATPAEWWSALVAPDPTDPRQLVARHVLAPRIAIALLAGAGLALAGTLLQQALRNPMADPTTLGTSAGAALALTSATLYAPWLLENGREMVALAGAALATLIAFSLANGRSFSPVTLILSGLVVTLVAGSAAATLTALNSDYVTEIFIWQSGSLIQNGNGAAAGLIWRLLVAAVLALLLLRPLSVLGLDDGVARAVGLSPRLVRFLTLSLAVAIAASVTAAVGVIAFVGLAAPAIARLTGARTLRRQILTAPVVGALLLLLTDRLVAFAFAPMEVPTGAATAVLGAPVILLILPAVRRGLPSGGGALEMAARRSRRFPAIGSLLLLALVVLLAIGFGREWDGWGWLAAERWNEVAPLRAPRVLAAAAAGVLLAFSGTILQRVTGNAMASPEFLGVSGGATVGVVLLMLVSPTLDRTLLHFSAAGGALAALSLVLGSAGRGSHAPERILLAGITVATLSSSLAALMLASGDPRVQWLQAWMSGSTYRVGWTDAGVALVAAGVLALLLPALIRWITILPLGGEVSSAVGIGVRRARLLLLGTAAAGTAIATLTIGPLSFVGLMAPPLALMMGFRRPVDQLAAAALIGAVLLIGADWLGRTIIFPWQVPAGLLSAVIGAPVFAWLLRETRTEGPR